MLRLAALALVLCVGTVAEATVNIATVTVGNAGNVADTTGYGAVAYSYNIGKYEVTAGQYTAFLNAVAATDPYGLYNQYMVTDSLGCQIQRSGSSGSYSYSVSSTYANRPVNYASFWDACRFSNWLNNGQGGAGTTEYGTYSLNGVTNPSNASITRNAGATWAVCSENEWYKAAYYKGGSTNAGYWLYPTGSDSITTAMANYGSVGHTTDGGSYAYPSPYGTYDQGGNVWEWNEAIIFGSDRGLRGGSYRSYDVNYLQSAYRLFYPTYEGDSIGFRVSEVPEPATMGLLALGGLGLLARRRAARMSHAAR